MNCLGEPESRNEWQGMGCPKSIKKNVLRRPGRKWFHPDIEHGLRVEDPVFYTIEYDCSRFGEQR